MIDINGRSFVDRGVTGVQRYAREITSVLSDQTTISPAPHWQNGIRGHLWEQSLESFKYWTYNSGATSCNYS